MTSSRVNRLSRATGVWPTEAVLAPRAELYPHPGYRQLTKPLRSFFKTSTAYVSYGTWLSNGIKLMIISYNMAFCD